MIELHDESAHDLLASEDLRHHIPEHHGTELADIDIDATSSDHPDRRYSLTSRASCGNSRLEADVHDGDRHVYAYARADDIARAIWAEMERDLEEEKT